MKRGVLKRGDKPIRPVSAKQSAQLDVYRQVRETVRARAHGMCELGTPVCVRRGSEVQHLRGRVGALLTDVRWMRWTCRPCHRYAHANPAESYERGWMVKRHGEVGS